MLPRVIKLMESIVDGIFSTSFAGKCLQVIAPRCSCQVMVMANETPKYSLIGVNRFKVLNLKLPPKKSIGAEGAYII